MRKQRPTKGFDGSRLPPLFIPDGASKAYRRALHAAREFHLTSKTYSGKLVRPHAPFIHDIAKAYLVQGQILDYGCGKGAQYEWVAGPGAAIPEGLRLEQFWGRMVRKYDPAWPPFAEPLKVDDAYDMTLCTHVLGSIPTQDLDCVLREILRHTRKVLYVAEQIGDVGKRVFDGDGFPRWSREEWTARLLPYAELGPDIYLATRERGPGGKVITVAAVGPTGLSAARLRTIAPRASGPDCAP